MPPVIAAIAAFANAAFAAFAAFVGSKALAWAIIKTALTFAISAATSALFAPKIGDIFQRQADTVTLTLGEAPREAIFGEACTGGTLLDAFNYGGDNDWEVLAVALADHECHALSGFYVNDNFYPFTANGAQSPFNDGEGDPCLYVYWQSGTLTQTPPAYLTTNSGGRWTSNDKLVGVSYVVAGYRRQEAIFPQGRPRFRWVLKGKKLYDPRKDSTVPGGSGAHRWNTESTREYDDNAAVCEYNWRRGVWTNGQLIIGPGRSEEEAPPAEAFAAMNACDEAVARKAGGTEKRYRASAVVRANERWIDTQKEFARAMAGDLIDRNGSPVPDPGIAKTVETTFTDADLVEGGRVEYTRWLPRDELVNTVTTRFINTQKLFQPHSAPIRRDTSDITADTEPRELPLELPYVTSPTQAQRVAEIARRRARYQRRATVTLGARFMGVETGDWLEWTSARYQAGAAIKYEVTRVVQYENATVELGLREIAAGAFSWTAATDELDDTSEGFVEWEPLPDASLSGLALESITVNNGDAALPGIQVTWTPVTDQSIKRILCEWRVQGDARVFKIWINDPRAGAFAIWGGLVSEATYEVRLTPGTDPKRGELPTNWSTITVAAANSSTFRDVKFKRSTAQPDTPTGDNPEGWSDGVPAGTDSLWLSTATKSPTGALIGAWTTPEKITGLNLRGQYDPAETYYLHDVVTFAGGSFVCIAAPTTGHAPNSSGQANAYWDVLAAPGQAGAPGDPPTEFVATIDISSSTTGANLYTLAEAAGYTGASDATITFEVESGVTVIGLAGAPNGGIGIDTGTWPGGYDINLALVVKNGGKVYAGGGLGGWGGRGISGLAEDGAPGGQGGDAVYCRHPIAITVNTGGEIKAGGGGGGGGGGDHGTIAGGQSRRGGGGGGGGAPNGPGGPGGEGNHANGNAGSAGTTSGGGAGGTSIPAGTCIPGNGGDGGTFGASASVAANNGNGSSGGGGAWGWGGAPGGPGYAVRKNGLTVPVTNNGTIVGTAA